MARNEKGRWTKGTSGNAGGMTSEEKKLREELRIKTLKRLKKVIDRADIILKDENGNDLPIPKTFDEHALEATKQVAKITGMEAAAQIEVKNETVLSEQDTEMLLSILKNK